jgi:fructose-1,6-bisphosphatase/inositol monophosphatase family enzyme
MQLERQCLYGHIVGIVLKELVRRAIITIRNERQVFAVTQKAGYSGDLTDVFTSADQKAQEVYLRSLRECFPDYGIVAEEDKLSIEPLNGITGYFTVDPLDGTKAFIRRQSQGVGTMVALVDDGRVQSAYIGDVNTQEIYGFRPASSNVHRISEYETAERLEHSARQVSEMTILLRDAERAYAPPSLELIGRFKKWEIQGGSIGIWMARIWKREVGAALLLANTETPWGSAPVIGISQALGYGFYRFAEGKWQRYEPRLSKTVYRRDHDLLVVHPDDFASNQLFR